MLPVASSKTSALSVEFKDGLVKVTGDNFVFAVSKQTGAVTELSYSGKPIIATGSKVPFGNLTFNGYRSISNDRKGNQNSVIEAPKVTFEQDDDVIIRVSSTRASKTSSGSVAALMRTTPTARHRHSWAYGTRP